MGGAGGARQGRAQKGRIEIDGCLLVETLSLVNTLTFVIICVCHCLSQLQ